MAHFHFNIITGTSQPDTEGIELADQRAAKTRSLKILGEYLHEDISDFWNTQKLEIVVTDEGGLILFRIAVAGLITPSAPLPVQTQPI